MIGFLKYSHKYASSQRKTCSLLYRYGTVQMQRPTREFESETLLVNLRTSTRTRAQEHSKVLERACAMTLECLH